MATIHFQFDFFFLINYFHPFVNLYQFLVVLSPPPAIRKIFFKNIIIINLFVSFEPVEFCSPTESTEYRIS